MAIANLELKELTNSAARGKQPIIGEVIPPPLVFAIDTGNTEAALAILQRTAVHLGTEQAFNNKIDAWVDYINSKGESDLVPQLRALQKQVVGISFDMNRVQQEIEDAMPRGVADGAQ